MFDWITENVTGTWWSYLLVTTVVAIDAVLPVFPSETALITGGILAEQGEVSLVLLVLAGAAGAVAGDTVLFLLGRGPGQRFLARVRNQERVEWMRTQLYDRTWILIVADFLPGGRTAAMLAAGSVDLPARRFYAYIVPGATLWALFEALLGYAGGSAFEDNFLASFIAALAVALLIGVVAEMLERRRRRR